MIPRNFLILAVVALALPACKKEQPAAPPAPAHVAAPAQTAVQPGMEAENPAEKEGQP